MRQPPRGVPSGPAELELDYVQMLRGVLRRRKKLVIVSFALLAVSLIGMSIYGSRPRPRYRSSGTVLMGPSIVDRILATREFAPVSGSLPVQLAVLRSRSLAQEVLGAIPKESVQELMNENLKQDYFLELSNRVRRFLGRPPIVISPRERAIAELSGSRMKFVALKAEDGRPDLSGLVRISATAFNPRVAMDLVNTYIQVLVNWTRRSEQEDVAATRKFLELQVSNARRDLKDSEGAMIKFEEQHGEVTLTGRTELEVVRLVRLQGTLAEVQANQAVTRSNLDALQQTLRESPDNPSLPSDAQAKAEAAQRMRTRLQELELVLLRMQTRYTDEHPSLIAVREEIQNLRTQLAQIPVGSDSGPQARGASASRAEILQAIDKVKGVLASLQLQEQSIRLQIEKLRKNLRRLSGPEFEFSQLSRSQESNRALLSLLLQKLLALEIRGQSQGGGIKVIDPANLPVSSTQSQAVSFRKLAFLLALALASAVGVGFLVEYIYQPVESEKAIRQELGLPLLGSAVAVPSRRPKGDGRPLLVFNEGRKPGLPQELYRGIRMNLEAANLQKPFKAIMISSACPGEGKSTTAINLTMALRELGRRVVLVDADLRHPSLSKVLPSGVQGGLADILHGPRIGSVMAPIELSLEARGIQVDSDFAFIPSGNHSGDPGALLSSARAKEFVELLKQGWDYALFDSPPLLMVSDNLLFAASLDGVILVAQAERTKKRDLQRAKDHLERAGAHVLGVILNQVSPGHIPYHHRRYRNYYAPRTSGEV